MTATGFHGARILLVDDDPDFAAALELLLQTEGYEIVTAHSAAAVKELLVGFEPDVALIDVRLAGSSGIDLIQTVKQRSTRTLCVMMTAYASADTAIEALQGGAYDFLRKPFRDTEVLATLDRSLQRLRLEAAKASLDSDLRSRNEELVQINERLEVVVQSMRGLPGSTELVDLCPKILTELARNVAAKGGSFYLIEAGQLVLKHALDSGHAPVSIPLAAQRRQSVFSVALESSAAVLVEDITSNESLRSSGWGSYGDTSLLAYPLLGDDGQPIGVLSLHTKRVPPFTVQDRDIGQILVSFACETIRAVQALEDLAESEERLRSLIDTSPMCIQELNLSGQILSMNRAGFEMLGLDPEDPIIGHNGVEHIAAGDQTEAQRMFDQACAGAAAQFQAKATLSNRTRTLHTSFVPLVNPDGTVHKVMAVAEDITERQSAEEQLHHNQKMDALGQLTSGVAHDVNNMLAVVMGNADLLLRLVGDDHELVHHANQVIRAAARGGELTQRLLAFSRRQPLHARRTDLAALIADMSNMLTGALGATIDIDISVEDGAWPVHADPSQAENAILNLVLNARDAMPDGGNLTIEVANVPVAAPEGSDPPSVHESHDCVQLAVTDTGTGMAPEILDRVFEPFFTTKAVGEGSGMGLSMVYGFANQSGGGVRMESTEGEGSTVFLVLPKSDESAPESTNETTDSEPGGSGQVVLVVEDDSEVRAIAVSMLQSLGYSVVTAADGATAIETIAGTTIIDLLLSDVILPGGISGADVAAEGRRLRPGIRVLFMSGYSDMTESHRRALASGSDLVHKPFRRADLAHAVWTVLHES